MNAVVTADFDTLTQTAEPTTAAAHTPLNRMHPRVFAITLGVYVALIAAFTIGFTGPTELGIAFGIVFTIAAACVAVPWMMARSAAKFWANHDQPEAKAGSYRAFLNGKFDTASGPVSGRGALALVITVPTCLTFGVIAMAIVSRVV